jgi:phosphomethylpyrimidine synthase
MKITKDLRKYSAEQGIAEEEALNKGMGGMSKEFVASVRTPALHFTGDSEQAAF